MRYFEAETLILADAETVWRIITDGAGFTAWDSGITAVDGVIRDGSRIRVRADATGRRVFAFTVQQDPDHHRMTWTARLPLGLFRGVRTFTLTDRAKGTHLKVKEEYFGPLAGLMFRGMPDLRPSFRQFAAGAKARAEAMG